MPSLRVVLACLALSLPQIASAGTLKELAAGPLSAQQTQWLASLKSAPMPEWMGAAENLATKANTSVLAELVKLSQEKSDDLRIRAGRVLIKIRAKQSLAVAMQLALADKSTEVRKAVATDLCADGVADLLKPADLLAEAKQGIADKIDDVRFAFAMILAKNGDAAATPTLKEMLKHSDHHRRESAAESLAELGDDSGGAILIKMLEYTEKNHPLLVANKDVKKDEASWNNLLRIVDAERIRLCGHIGKLKLKKAKGALEKLAAAKNPKVAEAAQHALNALAESAQSVVGNSSAGRTPVFER
ncbi:MAG: HEAT repeat domain-containing protein [Planctomycetota bacterium]